jgi:hypothetical protein
MGSAEIDVSPADEFRQLINFRLTGDQARDELDPTKGNLRGQK